MPGNAGITNGIYREELVYCFGTKIRRLCGCRGEGAVGTSIVHKCAPVALVGDLFSVTTITPARLRIELRTRARQFYQGRVGGHRVGIGQSVYHKSVSLYS